MATKVQNVLATTQAGQPYNVFQDRLKVSSTLYKKRGLMRAPKLSAAEELQIRSLANILNQLTTDMVLEHPRYAMKLALNETVGAKLAYLISVGDYVQHFLDAVDAYVQEGDRVLDIGAGLGVSGVLAAQCSGQKVTLVEPNPSLQYVMHKNCELNKVEATLVQACLVAGQKMGTTEFFIAEEPWSSSIFAKDSSEAGKEENVPVKSVDDLVQESEANTLLVDIQGAELGIFDEATLDKVQKAVVAIHTPLIGETNTAKVVNAIILKGFHLVDIRGWTFVFEKKA
jgi:FkbM family methyltransferase